MDLVNDDLPYRFGLWIWRFHIYLIDSTYRFGTWLRGGSLPYRLAYRFGIYICSNAHWRQTFLKPAVNMMRLARISQRAFFFSSTFQCFRSVVERFFLSYLSTSFVRLPCRKRKEYHLRVEKQTRYRKWSGEQSTTTFMSWINSISVVLKASQITRRLKQLLDLVDLACRFERAVN